MSATERGTTGRIAFVCGWPVVADLARGAEDSGLDVGGAQVQLVRLGRLLSERGWEVSYVTPELSEQAGVEADNMRIIPAYVDDGRYGRASWLLHKLPGVWRAMKEADADIYITRSASWLTGLAALFARRHRRRSLYWMAACVDAEKAVSSSSLSPHAGALYRLGIRTADAIVAQTEDERRLMFEATGRDAVVIPNVWLPTAADGRRNGQWRADVLWVGRFHQSKRPAMALEVAARLPDVRFALIGGPSRQDADLYHSIAAHARTLPNVRCTGQLPPTELAGYYANASLLLHTSESEGLPNVFLEAWGHGLPVVSSFDPDGLLTGGGLGLRCETVEQMAEAIKRFGEDAVMHSDTGSRAREYVCENFSVDAVMPKVEGLLRDLACK